MKKIVFDGEITFADGKTYSINAREKQGCFLEIVERIKQQLDAMLSYHRKVFVCIFLFHLHDYTQENALFSKFMRKLVKRLKQRYGFKRIGYAWVREHGSGQAQHYHLALFLDGSLIQYPQGVFELAADIWEGWNQPRPALNPKRSYYMVTRGGDAGYQVAFHHLSYLAKTRTKAARAKTTNDYSASRLRLSRAR
jgi:hypothetical protein